MAAARSKVGILQPGCPRIALASCPARAAHRLTDHPCVRRQCLAFLSQPELSAPVGGRAPGLRSEGSCLAAELLRAGLEPGAVDRRAGLDGLMPVQPCAQGAPPPACPACRGERTRAHPPWPSLRAMGHSSTPLHHDSILLCAPAAAPLEQAAPAVRRVGGGDDGDDDGDGGFGSGDDIELAPVDVGGETSGASVPLRGS